MTQKNKAYRKTWKPAYILDVRGTYEAKIILNNSPIIRWARETRVVTAFTTTYCIHLSSENFELPGTACFQSS